MKPPPCQQQPFLMLPDYFQGSFHLGTFDIRFRALIAQLDLDFVPSFNDMHMCRWVLVSIKANDKSLLAKHRRHMAIITPNWYVVDEAIESPMPLWP
jgi:hypothetical protein